MCILVLMISNCASIFSFNEIEYCVPYSSIAAVNSCRRRYSAVVGPSYPSYPSYPVDPISALPVRPFILLY